MRVYWSDPDAIPLHTQTLLKQVISAGLRLHHIKNKSNIELNISFVTLTEMQELNHQYRSKNEPTDVLSFTSDGENLGDIIICLDVAKNQAKEYGHSMERELAFLTAHGFLHLLGYDHLNPSDEADMIQAQKEILDYVGIGR